MYFMLSDFQIILNRRLSRIRKRFRRLWRNYLYQSFFATVVVAIVFLVLSVEHAVIISSIGATAFIIFTMPRNLAAKPRRVIGGHAIGLLAGSLTSLIPHSALVSSVLVYSLAVGLSILLMVALDAEHPPASGTALGTAIAGSSPTLVLAVLTSSILLSVAHHLLKKYLKDLV